MERCVTDRRRGENKKKDNDINHEQVMYQLILAGRCLPDAVYQTVDGEKRRHHYKVRDVERCVTDRRRGERGEKKMKNTNIRNK